MYQNGSAKILQVNLPPEERQKRLEAWHIAQLYRCLVLNGKPIPPDLWGKGDFALEGIE